MLRRKVRDIVPPETVQSHEDDKLGRSRILLPLFEETKAGEERNSAKRQEYLQDGFQSNHTWIWISPSMKCR